MRSPLSRDTPAAASQARFYAADESCSDPASTVYFDCVARYYFLATFEARRWRSSPSVGRLMVFQDFLDFLVFLVTSEVAGPGPNPREIDISFGAQWPLACARPDPTIGWTDVLPCVFVVFGGGILQPPPFWCGG